MDSGSARIIMDISVQDGPVSRMSFKGNVVTIGRELGVECLIPSAAVSRQHGVLEFMHGVWLYSDLISTNGSWIDGESVEPGYWVIVSTKSKLQLADALVRIVFSESHRQGMPAALIILGSNNYREMIDFSDENQEIFLQLDDESVKVEYQESSLTHFKVGLSEEGKLKLQASQNKGEEFGLDDINLESHFGKTFRVGKFTLVLLDAISDSVEIQQVFNEDLEMNLEESLRTLEIAAQTMDLSLTRTLPFGSAVKQALAEPANSSVRTRRASEEWSLGKGNKGGGSVEGRLAIAIALVILLLILLVLVAWLLG